MLNQSFTFKQKLCKQQCKSTQGFASPIEKVFRAFSDADAYSTWLPPYGFIAKTHHYDFKKEAVINVVC